MTQPIILAAQTNAIAVSVTTIADSKRKAKWIVTGTILQMIEEKRYDLALDIATQGVTKYPDFPPFHLARGIALFESGNLEKARPSFEKAKQLYLKQKSAVPQEEKSAYESGLHGVYLYLAKYDLPNPKINFSLNPKASENDLKAMAQLSLDARRYDNAEPITSYAMQKYPNQAAPYFQRAIARYKLGRTEEAKVDFQEALKRYQVRLESAKTDSEKIQAQNALEQIELERQKAEGRGQKELIIKKLETKSNCQQPNQKFDEGLKFNEARQKAGKTNKSFLLPDRSLLSIRVLAVGALRTSAFCLSRRK